MSVQAMSWVIENAPYGGSKFVLLLMIANYAKADGSGAFPSLATLAKDCRMSRRQIVRLVRSLEESQDLFVTRSTERASNYYAINMASDRLSLVTPATLPSDIGVTSPSDAIVSPYPSTEPSVNHQLCPPPADVSIDGPAEEAVEEQPLPKAKKDADAEGIFEFWKGVFEKNNNAKFTPDRKRKVIARLKEGYTVEDIRAAIIGCSMSSYHIENNFNDLELICRNGSKLENFMAKASVRPATKPNDDDILSEDRPESEFTYSDLIRFQRNVTEPYDENGGLKWVNRELYERSKDQWFAVHLEIPNEEKHRQINEYEATDEFRERFDQS